MCCELSSGLVDIYTS